MTGWRARVLLAALLLLYGGLFLGGMALTLSVAIPFGLAVLLLYTVLMRPLPMWAGSPLRLAGTVIVLSVLAALLALAGGGLARLTGPVPAWPGPVAALAGVALSRLVWSADKASRMDAFLDEALAGITAQGAAFAGPPDEDDLRRTLSSLPEDAAQAVRRALAAVTGLAPEADASEVDRALDPVEAAVAWDVAGDELARMDGLPALRARAALVLRPTVAGRELGSPSLENAVNAALAADVPDLSAEVARRGLAAVEAVPHLWAFFPPDFLLREAAARVGPPAGDLVTALADRIAALAAECGAEEAEPT